MNREEAFISICHLCIPVTVLFSPAFAADDTAEQSTEVEEQTETAPSEELTTETPVVEDLTASPSETEPPDEPSTDISPEDSLMSSPLEAPEETESISIAAPLAEASVTAPLEERIVSPWTTVLPFGIPQFAQGEPTRGWTYAGIQAVGVAASIYTGLEMRELALAGEVDRELTYRLVSAATVAVTALTWFTSVVDGSNMRIEAIDRAQAARDWDMSQQTAALVSVVD